MRLADHIQALQSILSDFYPQFAVYDLSGSLVLELPDYLRPVKPRYMQSVRIALKQHGYFISGTPDEHPGGILAPGRVLSGQCVMMMIGHNETVA